MADSMHLDSSDLVGSLDEFENLEHIPGDFDTFSESHEEIVGTKHILPHSEEEMQIIQAVHSEEVVPVVVKEEVVEKMEEEVEMETEMVTDQEDIAMNPDMSRVIEGRVNVENILTVESDVHDDGLDGSQDLFSGDIIEEVVVGDEQIEEEDNLKLQDPLESSIDHFVEEEVISETLEDVTSYKGSLMDSVVSMEMPEPIMEEVVKSEPVPVTSKMVTSGVYVVATNNSNIVSAQSFLPGNTVFTQKDVKGSPARIVMSPVDNSSGHTIKIVPGQGKLLNNQGRTITLTQARQMGLFTPAKLNTILPTTILPKPNNGQQMVTQNKVSLSKKGSVGGVKSPTKILPVPSPTSPKPHKLVIRQATALKPGTVLTNPTGGQVIRIPASQTLNNVIQLPGKQVQYVKLVGGSGSGKPVQGTTIDSTNKTSIPVALTSSIINPPQTMFKLVPIAGSPGGSQRVLIPATSQPLNQPTAAPATNNLVVLPSPFIQTTAPAPTTVVVKKETKSIAPSSKPQSNGRKVQTPVAKKEPSPVVVPSKEARIETVAPTKPESWSGDEATITTYEANGIRPRKPCNCTKSMCLKLYCDCFANGEFCNQCNCTCCYNNLEHEEERQRAIKSCLERNPTAFRPKIGKSYMGSEERRHNKGCNCRRSGCLKNYCECYEAKIPCSKNCKCFGCKNVDSPFVMRREDDPRVMSSSGGSTNSGTLLRLIKAGEAAATKPPPYHHTSIKQAYSLMSNEVVEATCQCLLAQAEDWEREDTKDSDDLGSGEGSLDVAQSLILEEFGRCVVQIIECVAKSTSSLQATPT